MKWIKLFESYNKQDKVNKANEIFCYFGLERTFTKSLAELTWVESRQVYITPSNQIVISFDSAKRILRIKSTYINKNVDNFIRDYARHKSQIKFFRPILQTFFKVLRNILEMNSGTTIMIT